MDSEGDSDYTGDDSFTESDYATSDDYEEAEYDYQLAEDPVPLEEVRQSSSFNISVGEGKRDEPRVADKNIAPLKKQPLKW